MTLLGDQRASQTESGLNGAKLSPSVVQVSLCVAPDGATMERLNLAPFGSGLQK